jgi:hypothetical protein
VAVEVSAKASVAHSDASKPIRFQSQFSFRGPHSIERSRLRLAARFMQNRESICVGLGKSPQLQIVSGDLRQLPMTPSGVAAVGKWQIEAAVIEQASKLCSEAHPTRTVLL